MKGSLEALVAAVELAIDRAAAQLDAQQLRRLRDYFDENDQPVYLPLRLPYLDPSTGELLHREVQVPRLCLAPLGFMQMEELELELPLSLEGLAESGAPEALLVELTPVEGQSENGARMRLRFKGGESPQALMKLNDLLTRIIP